MNLKCLLGHDWKFWGSNCDCSFADTGQIVIDFYECRRCKKRTAYSTNLRHKIHPTTGNWEQRWIKARVLPAGTIFYDPNKRKDNVVSFDIIEGDKK